MHTLHSPCTHPTWAPGWVCCRVTADHELCPVHLQTPPVCWCPRISHPEMSLLSSAAAQPEPLACAPPASWSLYGTRWPHATSSVSIFKAFFFFFLFFSPLPPLTSPASPDPSNQAHRSPSAAEVEHELLALHMVHVAAGPARLPHREQNSLRSMWWSKA